MPEMLTTKEIAAELQYTEQYVNRKVLEYCTAHRISKTYFGRPKPGKGGGRQYTRKEVDKLKAWLNGEDTAASEQPAPEVTVETGNHLTVIDQPELLGRYSLEAIRGGVETVLFSDPLEVAAKLTLAARQLKTAFLGDVAARNQKNAETLEAARVIEDEVRSLEIEALKYQLRTEMISASTNASTKRLETAVNRFESITKRKGGESTHE